MARYGITDEIELLASEVKAAATRRCKVCGLWKPVRSFGGRCGRAHTCTACRVLHVRSFVLTDQGREVIKYRRAKPAGINAA